MAYENITLDVSPEGTAVLTLNRPEKRNAFNAPMIEELSDAFETLSKNPECRLLLIRGAGSVFSAGADLEWMKAASHYSERENEEDAYAMAHMLRQLFELPQITIALLHGAAMAGACGIAAAADIAIARKGTIFSFSEVKLGIIPATISPYVIRAMGERAASRYFLSAERFDAAEAYRIGFVHDICLPAELDGRVNDMLGHLILGGARAIEECKKLIQLSGGTKLTPAVRTETARRIARQRATDEARDGIAAFLDKRPPSWLL